MGRKTPMSFDELMRVKKRARVGSRLKIEFVPSFHGEARKMLAMANLLGQCRPPEQAFVVANRRRAALEAAGDGLSFNGSRVFVLRVLKDLPEHGGPLIDALHSGLITRMRKV